MHFDESGIQQFDALPVELRQMILLVHHQSPIHKLRLLANVL